MLSIDEWLEEKPYREVYDNRIYEKTGGAATHAITMGHVGRILNEWCAPSGASVTLCGSISPPEYHSAPTSRSFVSDTAPLTDEERQTPPFAPDIVAEIRAPEDRDANVDRKRELYLGHGSTIVWDVDPPSRSPG